MDEIDIADCGNNQRFKCRSREPLDNACGEEIVVGDFGLANSGPDNVEERGDNEDWSFAIFPAECRDCSSRVSRRCSPSERKAGELVPKGPMHPAAKRLYPETMTTVLIGVLISWDISKYDALRKGPCQG